MLSIAHPAVCRESNASSSSVYGERKAKMLECPVVNDGRKRVLLIAASILTVRSLAQLDRKPSPAIQSCIADAIADAEKTMRRIDRMRPSAERSPS